MKKRLSAPSWSPNAANASAQYKPTGSRPTLWRHRTRLVVLVCASALVLYILVSSPRGQVPQRNYRAEDLPRTLYSDKIQTIAVTGKSGSFDWTLLHVACNVHRSETYLEILSYTPGRREAQT